MFEEKAQDIKGVTRPVNIDIPEVNYCPLCHKNIKPYNMSSFLNGATPSSEYLQKIIRCPSCNMIFLALFKLAASSSDYRNPPYFRFERSEPYRPSEPAFTENIKTISPSFCTIYAQAKNAEELGLSEICGVGYRKALEFLIKDYLISKKTELGTDESTIKKTTLGNCIKNLIQEPKIREMAELATWLGNDETHYVRKWESKDLSDLKELIHLTMNTIDSNMIFEKHKRDMKSKS
jgi:hypothetical protein